MIRSSKHILKFQTKSKTDILGQMFCDYKRDLEYYIDLIIVNELPLQKRFSSKNLPENVIKYSAWKCIIYQTASEIIRSQIKKANNKRFKQYKKIYIKAKKHRKFVQFTSKKFKELSLKNILQSKFFTKPCLKNITITLTAGLADFSTDSTHFDEFIRIRSPYFPDDKKRAITICLPFKYHKHSNRFKNWNRKKSIRLHKINGNYYLGLIYEKEEPAKKHEGKVIGIDQGYKKLLACSDGQILGQEINGIYKRIANKQQGSKAFNRLLVHRNNEINRVCNMLQIDSTKEIVIEDLKNVKRNSKIHRKTMNKVQRWSYPKTVSKLARLSEENGILLTKVNPAYTSQKCSLCGYVDKKNRSGELFTCQHCGYVNDADINAAVNISHMGVYSLHSLKKAS